MDLKLIARSLGYLNGKEKVFVLFMLVARFLLVGFDLAGIVLVGVVVSLVSGTIIAKDSKLSLVLHFLDSLGYKNGYVALAIIAVLFFIMKGCLSVALTYITASRVARIEAEKSSVLYRKFLNSDLGVLDQYSRQDMLHGLTGSVNSAFSQTINVAVAIVGELALLVGISAYLAITDLVLFAIVAAFFGAIGFAMQATLGKASGKAAGQAHSGAQSSQGLILTTIENFRQLSTSTGKKSFSAKFSSVRRETAKQNAVYSTITTLPRYITEIAVMVGVGLLVIQRVGLGGGGVSAATIAVFLAGIFRIVASMLPVQAGLSTLKRIQPEGDMAFRLMEQFKKLESDPRIDTKPNGYAIDLRGVTFMYPTSSKATLENIDIHIPENTYAAIKGRSGQGKSTLADLILGLREPSAGGIYIGGIKPRDFISTDLNGIGYVPQKTTLFEGSIRENVSLKLGQKSRNDAPLWESLAAVELEEFVRSLPLGLETKIGPNGIDLSGGQIQRIGLARALCSNPKILVLDEVTSALDHETEEVIHRALLRLSESKTVLVIAHRPQTQKEAGLLITVSNGKITTEDRH